MRKNKSSKLTKVPLKFTTLSQRPFDKVFVDIVGPFNVSDSGNKYIISMMDDLTRFVEFEAITDQKAETVARALFENILCRYNIPIEMVTDNGTNFVGKVFKSLCKMFNVKNIQNIRRRTPIIMGYIRKVRGSCV